MALGTITKIDGWVNGNKRVKVVDVQLSTGANWTAAGESLTPAMVGLRRIVAVNALGPARSSTPTGFQVTYDYTNQKLIALAQGTAGAAVAMVAVTANTDLSTFTVRLEIIGY
jgi:hypothetical protein